jgi:DNA (cytosine-5)-methyltransferase 1
VSQKDGVKSSRPSALSLFSGAGGFDVGVRKAGFNVLAEIEIDKFCCETLKVANGREGADTVVYETDVRAVDPVNLGRELRVSPFELDLLFGGPPCQPFSLAGKRQGLDDERGPLLFEIVRFAEYLRPKVILLEQVKGLLGAKDLNGNKGGAFAFLISEISRLGYVATWGVFRAADYGVPQLRDRLFVAATRGEGGFSFPPRTFAPLSEEPNRYGLSPYVTVGEALKGLGEPSPKIKGAKFFDRDDSHVDVTPKRDRERIAMVPEGSYLAAQTNLSADLRLNLRSKDTTKFLRLDRKKPANTLRCGEIFYHPTEARYLTPREYMRLHGYEDDYKLRGPIRSRSGTAKYLDQHRQVANSVPPPLSYALGSQIFRFLNGENLR